MTGQRRSLPGRLLPVDFPSVEGLRVEYHGRGVPGLGTVDADFSSKLHPGDGEDGARIGTRQGEHVLLPMFQEPQHTSRERTGKSQAHTYKKRAAGESKDTGETSPLQRAMVSHLCQGWLLIHMRLFIVCRTVCQVLCEALRIQQGRRQAHCLS